MVHARYKDLAQVEWAFRTMKTTLLELRGIYVRKAARTRAHVFIIMLAYLLAYHLRRLWHDVEVTVEEGIAELASLVRDRNRDRGAGELADHPYSASPRPTLAGQGGHYAARGAGVPACRSSHKKEARLGTQKALIFNRLPCPDERP